ncbi:MAG: FixH family protein [Vicinamibacterales bacterium]
MSLLLAMAVTAAAACSSPQNSTVANNAPATTAAGPVDITFTTDPAEPKMGDNTFQVMVMQAGQPVNDAQVSVEFVMPAMPQMNMAEMRTKADLQPTGNGTYRATGQVMMAGNWDVTVMAMKNGQEIASKKLKVAAK